MRRQIQMDVIFLFKSQEYKLKLATICISISYLLIQHERSSSIRWGKNMTKSKWKDTKEEREKIGKKYECKKKNRKIYHHLYLKKSFISASTCHPFKCICILCVWIIRIIAATTWIKRKGKEKGDRLLK